MDSNSTRSTSITDRIVRQEVLLPINHNHKNIFQPFFKTKAQEIPRVKKKPFNRARVMARTVQLLRHDGYCLVIHVSYLLVLKPGRLIANQI